MIEQGSPHPRLEDSLSVQRVPWSVDVYPREKPPAHPRAALGSSYRLWGNYSNSNDAKAECDGPRGAIAASGSMARFATGTEDLYGVCSGS